MYFGKCTAHFNYQHDTFPFVKLPELLAWSVNFPIDTSPLHHFIQNERYIKKIVQYSEELVTLDILSSTEGAGRGRSSSWYWVSSQDVELRHSQHRSGQGHSFLPWPVLAVYGQIIISPSLSLVHISPARAWAATRRSPPAAATPALSPGLPSAGWGQQGANQWNQQLRTSKPSILLYHATVL